MSKQWIARGLALMATFGLTALSAQAGFVDASGIQVRRGDASPSVGTSLVNNYIFQDEQINIVPTDGLIKVLRTDQKNLVNDYVTATFPLRYASAREIRNVLRNIVGMEGGRAEVIRDRVTNDNFVQVIAPTFMVPYLRDAVAALDVQWLKEYWDGSVDLYLKLQNRGDAAFVDEIASNYAGDEGFTTVDYTNNALRRLDEEYRAAQYKTAVEIVDIPANQVFLEVKVYEIAGRNDSKIGLDYINWKNGPGRNLFQIAEAGYNAEQRARGFTSIFDPFLTPRIIVPTDNKVLVLDSAVNESYRAVNYLLPSSFVDFLQVKGKARVLTQQNLMVRSSETGIISTEQEILAFVPDNVTIPDDDEEESPGFPTGSTGDARASSRSGVIRSIGSQFFLDEDNDGVRDADEPFLARSFDTGNDGLISAESRELHYTSAGRAGMTLRVTPFVGLESMELRIRLEVGEANGTAGNGLPIINTRTVRSTVRLLDGQPFVIAGVSRDENVSQSAKAPWLGSLPIIGWAFGGETNLKRETDMIVVITPRFHVSSQSRIAKPARVDTLQGIIDGTVPLGLPDKHKIGYGMWDWWLFNDQPAAEDETVATSSN